MRSNANNKSVTRLKFPGSWNGIYAEGWGVSSFDPGSLTSDFVKIFKSDKKGLVGIKTLAFEGGQVDVVVKTHNRSGSGIDFFRSFGTGRAMKNFRLAKKLIADGMAVTCPIAAIEKRLGLYCCQSIYVNEYVENSMSLYDIVFGKDEYAMANWAVVKKQIINAIGQLLGAMHNKGYWHRDSKAGNFLICRDKNDSYSVRLIDLDGIKKYGLARQKRRVQTLWKLAETLSRFKAVSTVDFWRGFNVYCDCTNIEKRNRRQIFYELQKMVITKRLLTVVGDAYKKIDNKNE